MNAHDPALAAVVPSGRKPPGAWFWILALGALLGWMAFQLGWMTAHVFNATRFILYDQGSYLYAVGRWSAGEALYRDFAWQYGPLSLAWYRAAAAIGGNTPVTLVIASSLGFALAWLIAARLAVRAAGWGWGGGFALVGLLPVMSSAGVNAINGPHGAIEMMLLSLIAWTLSERPRARSSTLWMLGGLVGLLQWVRFGPHAMAFAGILTILAWQRWSEAADKGIFLRGMVHDVLRVAAGYALCVAPLVAWFFRALPAVGAWEMVWPAHMVTAYAATYPDRWPQIASVGEAITTWLPMLLGAGLVVATLLQGFSRREKPFAPPSDGAVAGLMLFPLYYVFGCVALFHNGYAITGHLWLAWPGLVLGALLPRGWLRALVAFAVAPALLASAAGIRAAAQTERTWQAQPLTLPNGQSLWFRPAEANRFGGLRAALGPTRRVAVFLGSGGIHHFFQTQRVGRHWWFLPEFVRPWEETSAQQAILRHDMILVVDLGQRPTAPISPGVLPLWIPLSKPMAEALLPHLKNPRHIEGVGDLLDVAP